MIPEEAVRSPRRLSIAHLALLIPWVALVIDAWAPIRDSSFLWHIRAGSVQAEAGRVLTEDPFSFTMLGQPWLTQSWLVELLYAQAEGWFGLDFVPLMILGVSSLTFLGIGLAAYLHSRSVTATAFILILSSLVMISFLVPRPVMFSFLLMIMVILAWDRPITRWAIPFLFWVWASSHGSFLIGLAYIGLTLVMRRNWRAWPTVVVAGLATLMTAHGLGVIEFLARFAESREALQYITEWRRPDLFSALFLPFLGGVLFVVIGAFRGKIRPQHLWLLVPFLLLGMSSVRAIPPAWLAIVPLIGIALADMTIGLRRGFEIRLAAAFALAVFIIPLLVRSDSGLSEEFPIEAAPALADVPTFHDDRAGGFLIWAEGPERPVYLDDRAELYGWRLGEFVRVRNGDVDWKPVFERDGIKQVMLLETEVLVGDLLDAGWVTNYKDDYYVILRPSAS